MADSKISALSAVTAPATTDVVPIVNAGTTKKVTIANLVNAVPTINKVTITAPATSATLTIPDGVTLNAGTGGTLGSAAFTAATAYEVPLTISTGLTRTVNTVTVNTSQNIATLSNLTSNGIVTTAGGVGTLGVTVPGTGVLTALGVNVGSAGAFVTFNGDAGTPSALVGTNISGTAAGLTAGNATTATNATNVATTTKADNVNYFLPFVAANSSSNQAVDVGPATYNPSTSTLTATTFVGNLTGNASGTAATVTGATQASITSAANLATVGTIGTGVWQGTAVGAQYGGTGQTVYAVGDVLYASTTTALSKLADVAAGSVLVSGGVGAAPAWSAAPALTSVTLGGGTALANYVEGTWTPTLRFGAGTTGITYAANGQVGTYTRIGDVVYFQVTILLSSKGSATGSATITGLPVAAASTTNQYNAGYVRFTNITTAGAGGWIIDPALTTTLQLESVSVTGNSAAVADTAFANNTAIVITGQYRAN